MNIQRGREHREKRKVAATERGEGRTQRSPEQQLKVLDERLGIGVGATRERARLACLIEKGKK